MKKAFKYITIFLLLVLFLLLATLAVIRIAITTNAMRLSLSDRLSEKICYKVDLQQSPQITFFPHLKASLHSMVLNTGSNSNTTYNIKADRVDLDLSWWKALHGEIDFSNISIINPVLTSDNPIVEIRSVIKNLFTSSYVLNNNINSIAIENGTIISVQDDIHKKVDKINGRIDFGKGKQGSNFILNANMEGVPISIKSSQIYDVSSNHLQFSNVEITQANHNIHGAMQVMFGDRLNIEGSLATDAIDLQRSMLEIFSSEVWHTVGLDLRVSASSAKYNKLQIKDLAITIQKNPDNLILGIGSAKTEYGLVTGSVKILLKDITTVESQAQFLIKHINCAALSNVVNGDNGDLVLSLQSSITLPQLKSSLLISNYKDFLSSALRANLHGRLDFVIGNCNITDYNLIHFLDDARNATVKLKRKRHRFVTYAVPYEAKLMNSNSLYKLNYLKLNANIVKGRVEDCKGILGSDHGTLNFILSPYQDNIWAVSAIANVTGKPPINFWLIHNSGELNLIALSDIDTKYGLIKRQEIIDNYLKQPIYAHCKAALNHIYKDSKQNE